MAVIKLKEKNIKLMEPSTVLDYKTHHKLKKKEVKLGIQLERYNYKGHDNGLQEHIVYNTNNTVDDKAGEGYGALSQPVSHGWSNHPFVLDIARKVLAVLLMILCLITSLVLYISGVNFTF
jgi:hypothetical protein